MLKKISLFFLLIFGGYMAVNCQYSELFNKIDAKHAFKDVVFGTSVSLLKTKMGLKQIGVEASRFQYVITNNKYLSIGRYNATSGFAHFSKKGLCNITLYIPGTAGYFSDILDYFTETFGEPVMGEGFFRWVGKKITYGIVYATEVGETQVIINSNLIDFDDGSDNF